MFEEGSVTDAMKCVCIINAIIIRVKSLLLHWKENPILIEVDNYNNTRLNLRCALDFKNL